MYALLVPNLTITLLLARCSVHIVGTDQLMGPASLSRSSRSHVVWARDQCTSNSHMTATMRGHRGFRASVAASLPFRYSPSQRRAGVAGVGLSVRQVVASDKCIPTDSATCLLAQPARGVWPTYARFYLFFVEGAGR